MNRKNKPGFSPRKCIACWKCVDECPCHAIRKISILWHRHAKPIHSRCIGCNRCTKVCPQGCFTPSSETVS